MSKEKATEMLETLNIALLLAPDEDSCSDAENEIFAEMANLQQALKNNIDALTPVLS